MLQKLISYSVNFIKVVGSLVAGFTALFYVAGFLAWNSRLGYLGMPEHQILDINYLITGAQFFVSFPLRAIPGFQFLRWDWILLPVIAFIGGVLIGIRKHNRKFSKWAFLATGTVLLVLLLIPLRMNKGAFFEYLPSFLDHQGMLFSEDITPMEHLENNYSRLIVLSILASVGTGLMLSWHKRIEKSVTSSETETKSTSEEPEGKDTAKRTLFRLSNTTPWRILSNSLALLIALITFSYFLLLPLNFIHPVYIKRYPVANISFSQEGFYPEIQDDTKLFLLERKGSDTGELLFYLFEGMEILQIRRDDIKEVRIIGHQSIWD